MSCPLSQATADGSVKYPELWPVCSGARELAKAQLDITQRYHLSPADFAWVGGSFPITLRGTGVIGSVTVSGLPDREDHQIVVDALCDLLGLERAAYRLPRQ